MAVAYKSIGAMKSTDGESTSTHTIATPSSFTAGDLLMMFHNQDANTFPTAPAGWNTLGEVAAATSTNSNQRAHSSVYWKISDGSEGSSQSWTLSSSSFPTGDPYCQGIMMAFSGASTTDPFDAAEWATNTTTATTAAQAHPSVTPTRDGSALVLFRASISANRTYTSTITSASPAGVERYDGSAFQSAIDCALYTREGFPIGAQSFSTTASNTCFGGSVMWSILIRPPAAATPIHSVGILIG